MLRKAAEPVLPSTVTWRRSKMGYPTPMARWLRQQSERQDITDTLFSQSLAERQLVCPRQMRQVWDQHQRGHDHSWLLFRLLTTELWFQQFIDQFKPNPVPLQRNISAENVSLSKAA